MASRLLRTAVRQHHVPVRLTRPVLVPLASHAPASQLRTRPPTVSCTAAPRRRQSTSAEPRPLTDRARAPGHKDDSNAARRAQEPAYDLTFTCKKCLTRSSHLVTKQAYHFGTTLITCPGCNNRHLISDHLKIFSDTRLTIEDILKEKGESLKRGRLGADGAIEFYDDVAQKG